MKTNIDKAMERKGDEANMQKTGIISIITPIFK